MFNRPPEEMATAKNWILWGIGRNKETNKLENDKTPFHYSRDKKYFFPMTSKAIKEIPFFTFDEILDIYQENKEAKNKYGQCLGIGYHFFGSKIVGLDFDDMYKQDGSIRPIFQYILDKCTLKTFIEYSKSKNGLHIYLNKDLDLKQFNIKFEDWINIFPDYNNLIGPNNKKPPGLDMYLDSKSKYFVYTGNYYPGSIDKINYNLSDFKKFYKRFSFYHEKKNQIENQERTKKRVENSKNLSYKNGYLVVNDVYSYIKSNINIIEVFRQYTSLQIIKNKGKHKCMLHNSNGKSLLIYLDGYFNCKSCGKQGSIIDLVMELFNIDKLSAAKKLSQDFNLNLKING